MKHHVVGILGALLALAVGCQTVPDDAPSELKQAEAALEEAEDADVDDLLPSAMEFAERKLDDAVDQWNEARKVRENVEDPGAASAELESKAKESAMTARRVALTALSIKDNIDDWNKNPDEFRTLQASADDYEAMQVRISVLEEENRRLKEAAEEQPTVGALSEDFELSHPVAFFDVGKAELKPAFEEQVEQLAQAMKANEQLAVTLEGHTDPTGSRQINERLSRERAEAVADRLRSEGIAQERIEIVTKVGEAKDSDPSARQFDRKVVATLKAVSH